MPALRDWLPQALTLRGQGLNSRQIGDQLGVDDKKIRAAFSRYKDASASDLAVMMTGATAVPVRADVILTEKQNSRVADLVVNQEERAAEVHLMSLDTIRDALGGADLDIKAKAWLAIEYLKVRKAPTSLTLNQQNNTVVNTTTPEDAHARLERLAEKLTTGSRKVLPPGPDRSEG